jgi:hypothetical protein
MPKTQVTDTNSRTNKKVPESNIPFRTLSTPPAPVYNKKRAAPVAVDLATIRHAGIPCFFFPQT